MLLWPRATLTHMCRPAEGDQAKAEDGLVDLLSIVRENGWSEARITALRNTCAAASTKSTLPPHERKFAKDVAAALSGLSAGITPAHMRILQDADLF